MFSNKVSSFALSLLAGVTLNLTVDAPAYADLLSNSPIEKIREVNRQRYDQIYPYYIEACSMTSLQRLDGSHGGSAGHAVAYVKGLCRDTSVNYPRVKVCEPGQYTPAQEAAGIGFNDIHNPDAGLGFSASKEFGNVNWVAIPSKSLFFDGGVGKDEVVTKETLLKIRGHLREIGTHRGVQIKSDVVAQPWNVTSDPELFAAGQSIDTDVAVNLARHLHCVHIPFHSDMLPRMVNYLNKLNDTYIKSNGYDWNVINDNCAHLVDNLLASIGFWPKQDTTGGFLGYFYKLNITNMAVPSISLFNIASKANLGSFNRLAAFSNNEETLESLNKDHWFATQHGSTIDILSAHAQSKNQVYKIGHVDQIFMLYIAALKQYAVKLARDPELVDIRANLEFFKNRYLNYQKADQKMRYDLTALLNETLGSMRTYVQMQLEDVQVKLNLLKEKFGK